MNYKLDCNAVWLSIETSDAVIVANRAGTWAFYFVRIEENLIRM